MRGAATENARRASSVGVLGIDSSDASDDRRGRQVETAVHQVARLGMLYMVDGGESTSNVRETILYRQSWVRPSVGLGWVKLIQPVRFFEKTVDEKS